jgi:tryptophan-rich sensory protein
MFGLLILLPFVLVCSVGAYFTANTICQRRWKEKIPQGKLVGFTTVFVIVFVALAIFMAMASTVVFGR